MDSKVHRNGWRHLWRQGRRWTTTPLLAAVLAGSIITVSCVEGQRERRPLRGRFLERLQERFGPEKTDAEALANFKSPVGYRVFQFEHPGWETQSAQVAVAVWYPSAEPAKPYTYVYGKNEVRTELAVDSKPMAGKYPLVIYSHGATGTGLSMTFLTERLASQGYVVCGVDYPDKFYGARITRPVDQRLSELPQQMEWLNDIKDYQLNSGGKAYRREKLAYRPNALKKTIDIMLEKNRDPESPYYQLIDETKIGVVGHSFGAWTNMLVAGADPMFKDPRIDCAVALSGPVNRNVWEEGELANIDIPVMLMYGSKEPGAGRASDKALLYDRIRSSKFLLEIDGADHFRFSGGIRKEFPTVRDYAEKDATRAAIVVYTMAFLDYYLKGSEAASQQLMRKTDSLVSAIMNWEGGTNVETEEDSAQGG